MVIVDSHWNLHNSSNLHSHQPQSFRLTLSRCLHILFYLILSSGLSNARYTGICKWVWHCVGEKYRNCGLLSWPVIEKDRISKNRLVHYVFYSRSLTQFLPPFHIHWWRLYLTCSVFCCRRLLYSFHDVEALFRIGTPPTLLRFRHDEYEGA